MDSVWLPLAVVEAAIPAMRRRHVSAVARGAQKSKRTRQGFVQAYRSAAGDPARMAKLRATTRQSWAERRAGFLARHLAQARVAGEPWWRAGAPTRRHLALVAWAYSPTPERLVRWLEAAL